ncbi:DNA polymerase III subunit beta [Anaerobacillus arseniciselenatis]|uniref:Beta sliding clamp n=1 Tax=Anaerobacillus arseniciselenatis TaxID=85682 RepID=A0A1S2LAG5_9BACI|nr:DNA polymerase III subunit beta [Anaerobacillus arseniciselenatis]OIJ09469.1 DNA polymerase III subunit beta [Anaerobacillus arseniciselenatis]
MTTLEIKETKTFIDLVGKASTAASTKTDSIRSGILVVAKENEISIRGTNETTSVELSAKDITETNEEVSFVAPAKIFLDMLRKLPSGDVEIVVEDGRLAIKVGKSSYGISTLAVDEYPKPVRYAEGKIFQVEAPTFADALSSTIHACSLTENRPILTGVHIVSNGKYLTLIATDSSRLMITAVPVLKETEEFKNVVIPKSSVKELTALLLDEKEVELSISDNQLSLKAEGVLFTTRLLEGSFPDVTQSIPVKNESEIVVHREELLKALERMKIALGKNGKIITTQVKEGTIPTLNIKCKTEITNFSEELFVEQTGSEISIKLHVYYLIDALQSMTSKNVRLQFAGEMKPVTIRPDIEAATQFGLVMPLR